MTITAMKVLLEWASKHSTPLQSTFAQFYAIVRERYAEDESLGGTSARVITFQMMRAIIDKFEENHDLPRTFTEGEIHA